MQRLALLLFSLSLSALISAPVCAENTELTALLKRQPNKIEDALPGNMKDRVYQRLAKAQKLMADAKYKDSLDLLDSLEEITKNNAYALAQVHQTRGYVFAQQEQFDKARQYFQKTLDLKALPLSAQLSTLYSLAQVTVAKEDYLGAVPLLQDYLHNRKDPKPDANFFYGQILAQLDAKKESVVEVEKAISLSSAPKESWYRLLAALHYELKNYDKASAALRAVIKINPEKKMYWKQLSSIYISSDKDREALATLELAEKKGFLTEEKDIIQLAQLSIYQGVPYKAGVYLEKGFENNIVAKTDKNFELLADAWIRAQELDKALIALDKAAPLAKNGKIYVRQGQLYLEKEQWSKSELAIRRGIKKGQLKKPGLAYIALGIAQYKMGKKQLAKGSFESAGKYSDQKKQAAEWLSHIGSEIASR